MAHARRRVDDVRAQVIDQPGLRDEICPQGLARIMAQLLIITSVDTRIGGPLRAVTLSAVVAIIIRRRITVIIVRRPPVVPVIRITPPEWVTPEVSTVTITVPTPVPAMSIPTVTPTMSIPTMTESAATAVSATKTTATMSTTSESATAEPSAPTATAPPTTSTCDGYRNCGQDRDCDRNGKSTEVLVHIQSPPIFRCRWEGRSSITFQNLTAECNRRSSSESRPQRSSAVFRGVDGRTPLCGQQTATVARTRTARMAQKDDSALRVPTRDVLALQPVKRSTT